MSRKLVLLTALIVVLAGTLGLAFEVERVEASGTIYIRANGLVEGTDKITNTNNITYTFIDNINGSIVVERDSIVVDGAGYTVQGTGAYDSKGIDLTNRSNITIKNAEVTNFWVGIYLYKSSNNSVFGNNITEHYWDGIRLQESSNYNTISENTVTNSGAGICLCWSSNYNKISANTAINNSDGIQLSSSSSSNNISGSTISNSTGFGIYVSSSSNQNTVSANNITQNGRDGIGVYMSSNITISRNNVTNNSWNGIWLCQPSSNNTIFANAIANNGDVPEEWGYGIFLDGCLNSTISRNDIVNNNVGVYLSSGASSNKFVHNNFIENTYQVYIAHMSPNSWDDGTEGNYWSNYTGVDMNRDGIGDITHIVDVNNTDHYPLMGMFSSFNTSLAKHVDIVSNSTIEDFEYFKSNSTIRLHVSNMTGDQAFGFCRICIPHVLMNVNNISVIIDDRAVEVLHFNDTICDNDTHRWIYFAYQHSIHKIDIIAEFPSLLILTSFMMLTLLTAIIYGSKHMKHTIV